jgi:hypothetical protein
MQSAPKNCFSVPAASASIIGGLTKPVSRKQQIKRLQYMRAAKLKARMRSRGDSPPD